MWRTAFDPIKFDFLFGSAEAFFTLQAGITFAYADLSRTKCIIMLMYETGFAIYFRGQL